MANIEIIDKAIDETLRAHPNFASSFSLTIFANIKDQVNLNNFTHRNGVRESLQNVQSKDFIEYIITEAVLIYGAIYALYPIILSTGTANNKVLEELNRNFPGYQNIIREMNFMRSNPSLNLINYYQINTKNLNDLVFAVISTRFNPHFYFYPKTNLTQGENWREKINNLGQKNAQVRQLITKIKKDATVLENITDLRFNPIGINRCLKEVMAGSQIEHKRNEYALGGTLFATQDVGQRRKNQEDSTIILTHPSNPSFKLLAVADGMGGLKAGEEVSNYVIRQLSIWFQNISKNLYQNPERVKEMLHQLVIKINQEVYEKYHDKAGSTLVAGVVTEKETIIVNVGDSRAYTIKDGSLSLNTEDNSKVWLEMRDQVRKEKRLPTLRDIDNLRFAEGNNLITKCIGQESLFPSIYSIKNDYDKLLLFSDGVHDLLSSDDIRIIATTTKAEDITKALVDLAISKDAENIINGQLMNQVPAGKDNTTAAAYIRR